MYSCFFRSLSLTMVCQGPSVNKDYTFCIQFCQINVIMVRFRRKKRTGTKPWQMQQTKKKKSLLFVWLVKPTGTRSCQLSPSSDKSNDPCLSHWSLSFRGCKVRDAHCCWKGCTCCFSGSSSVMPSVIVSGLHTNFMITSPRDTMAIL